MVEVEALVDATLAGYGLIIASPKDRVMQMNYAREKLHSAVTGMAVSAQTIQRRVCDAYIYNLIHIRPDGLPASFVAALAEITAAMSTRQPVGDEGGAWASCSTLSDDEASDLARKLADLWERVDSQDPMRTWA